MCGNARVVMTNRVRPFRTELGNKALERIQFGTEDAPRERVLTRCHSWSVSYRGIGSANGNRTRHVTLHCLATIGKQLILRKRYQANWQPEVA
jgi:hypothetical protein